MAYSVTNNASIRLNDVLSQLKHVIAKAEFLKTKTELTCKDKVTIKMSDLLMSNSYHYFNAETRLYISSLYISKADILRIMEARGEKLSRSGLEGRLYANARQFVSDFGIDASTILVEDKTSHEIELRINAIELTLLNIMTGLDYCNNNLDRLLEENGLSVDTILGFSSVEDISMEQVEKLIELIEPYTPAGKAKRMQELTKLTHVLWHFRKASLDGSDNATVNYILRSIL